MKQIFGILNTHSLRNARLEQSLLKKSRFLVFIILSILGMPDQNALHYATRWRNSTLGWKNSKWNEIIDD